MLLLVLQANDAIEVVRRWVITGISSTWLGHVLAVHAVECTMQRLCCAVG
jgi:hypothetical protein